MYIVQKETDINYPARLYNTPDSKVHGANMGPIWGRQDPAGPHVGPMNFAIWDITVLTGPGGSNVTGSIYHHKNVK